MLKLGRLKPENFREVKRPLENAGFQEASQRGSRVKFVRRTAQTTDVVIVPRRHEVPVGTLRSILNQAHVDIEEWERL